MQTIQSEKPILFNEEMVRAILDNRKTQTRRVVKTQFDYSKCPYGCVGDRLWVRETFVLENDSMYGTDNLPTDRPIKTENDFDGCEYHLIPHYRATEPEPHIVPFGLEDSYDDRTRWTSPFYMPRWASRITLEITDIRVEKIQDISFDDCLKEGIISTNFWNEVSVEELRNVPRQHLLDVDKDIDESWKDYARIAFSKLWDSINSKRGFSWESNPRVWVVEFKRIQQEKDLLNAN